MTVVISAAPGTASNSLCATLEKHMNCKALSLKSGGGIGHLVVTIPRRKIFLRKLTLNLGGKTLIYGHIFPTAYNLDLIEKHFGSGKFLINYRNIFDQIKYFYKWHIRVGRCPLSIQAQGGEPNEEQNLNIHPSLDLNILLTLFFYKHWFAIISENKMQKLELLKFDEIVSFCPTFQEKIETITGKPLTIKEVERENIHPHENFTVLPRHIELVENFVNINSNIDFSPILD